MDGIAGAKPVDGLLLLLTLVMAVTTAGLAPRPTGRDCRSLLWRTG